jgi:hypothetical protein
MMKTVSPQMACLALLCAPALLVWTQTVVAQAAGSSFDGNWTTSMACEAHGQMSAYKWDFPSVIKDGNFHGMHSQPDTAGYLEINGPIGADGTAKLSAKGWVSQSQAHGIFALKGNNYDYIIHAQFTANSGTGTRDKGVGILGRTCTFSFTKQTDTNTPPPASTAAPVPQ